MTEKHFTAIAAVIKDQVDASHRWRHTRNSSSWGSSAAEGALGAIKDTANALADYFASENPRFKRDKFLKLCGLGD